VLSEGMKNEKKTRVKVAVHHSTKLREMKYGAVGFQFKGRRKARPATEQQEKEKRMLNLVKKEKLGRKEIRGETTKTELILRGGIRAQWIPKKWGLRNSFGSGRIISASC